MHPTATNAAATTRMMMVTTKMFADAMTRRGNLHFHFDVFSTVHHSIDLFHLATLIYNSFIH